MRSSSGAARQVAVGSLTFSCVEWGRPDRPVVLLTHGVTAQARVWQPFAAELAAEYHVIAFDQRGHGDSDKPTEGYQAEDYAADMAGLLEAMGVDTAILVGHSLGARNALYLAGAEPRRAQAVVAIEYGPWICAANLDTLDRRVLGAPSAFDTKEAALEYLRGRYTKHSEEALRTRAAHGLTRLASGCWGWKYSGAAISQTLAGFRTDFDAQCLAISAPALVVRARETSLYDRPAFQRLMAARPDFEYVEIDGATHYVHEEQPQSLARLTRDFLERALTQPAGQKRGA